MEVICVNDKNFPNEIPVNKRVKKGEIYTVIETVKCNAQGGIFGYKLKEIDLTGCEPYLYFSTDRFSILKPIDDIIEENKEILAI